MTRNGVEMPQWGKKRCPNLFLNLDLHKCIIGLIKYLENGAFCKEYSSKLYHIGQLYI